MNIFISTPTDARGSTTNHVGRDQHNHFYQTIIVDGSYPARHPLHWSGVQYQPPANPDAFGSHSHALTRFSWTTPPADIAVGLIDAITRLVTNPADSRDLYETFKTELHLLQQTIKMTAAVLDTFKYTQLSRSLDRTISPEMKRCCAALFDTVNKYQQGLSLTHIWRQVWWFGQEMDGVRRQWSAHQQALGVFVSAVYSLSWEDLGNNLRAGHVSLRDLRTFLEQGPLPLQHIPVIHVVLVDHLGRRIPIPTLFCSNWHDFNYVVQGYCRGRSGERYIARGDYQVIRSDNSQAIDPSRFADAVQPGLDLEMSVILRKKTAFQDNRRACPRCDHMNTHEVVIAGWIECRHCSLQFQVANDDRPRRDETEEALDEVGSESMTQRGSGSDEHTGDINEQSPRESAIPIAGKGSDQEIIVDVQFFRRIHLICLTDVSQSPGDTFGRLLLSKELGFPLFLHKALIHPLLPDGVPNQFRQQEVRIGDVAIIRPDGSCHSIFNICAPADDPINCLGVPEGFEEVQLLPDMIVSSSDVLPPGSEIWVDKEAIGTQKDIKFVPNAQPRLDSAFHRLTSTSTEAAILILPDGASSYDLIEPNRFLRLCESQKSSWHKFVDETLGREASSVLLVTGCYKTTKWGISLTSKTNTVSSNVSATQPIDAIHHLWETFYPTVPQTPHDVVQNQCIFLRGYIMSRRRRFTKLRRS